VKEQAAVDGNINVPVFRVRFLEITKLSSVLKIHNGRKSCSSFISSDGATLHKGGFVQWKRWYVFTAYNIYFYCL
jgi:hypothetical protein